MTKSQVRHQFEFGFRFEQKLFRGYNLSPFSLWNLADQKANSHLSNGTNLNNPIAGEVVLGDDNRYYQVYGNEILVN